jgi:hypothetical protein
MTEKRDELKNIKQNENPGVSWLADDLVAIIMAGS